MYYITMSPEISRFPANHQEIETVTLGNAGEDALGHPRSDILWS